MIPQNRTQWRSFAGGEVSEEMYGRVDLPRHSIALKRCYNTVVTPQGVLENRAGSKFISTTLNNDPAWLVPFVRSDGQGFLLEFGNASIRVVGAGNVVNEETDPGDTFAVTNVDVWVEADGLPITPVVFTAVGHGFSPGDAIRFQGFSLVNPDQAGINQLAAFMNLTWYVYSVPSADTFTIIDHWPVTSASWNFGFELGTEQNLTYGGGDIITIPPLPPFDTLNQGSHTVDAVSPVRTGSYSLKLGWTDNPNAQGLRVVNSTRLKVTPGQEVTLRMYAYGQTAGDYARLMPQLFFYNGTSVVEIEELPLDGTIVGGEPRVNSSGISTIACEGAWTLLEITATVPTNATHVGWAAIARWGDSNWSIDDVEIEIGPALWNEFSYAPYFGLINGGTVALAANTVAVSLSPTYTWSHIRFASFAQFVDDLVIAHKLYPTAKVTRVSDNEWTFSGLSFNNTLAAPANIAVTAQGTPGTPAITYRYTVTTVNDDGAESPTGTEDTADNTLRTLGNFNDIIFDPVTDAFRYNIYKGIGAGSVYGFIGSTNGAAVFTDDNISPDFLKQPPDVLADFNAAGEYPGTVCFYEQRMILAGSVDEPQAFWASGLAAFDYFKASVPPQDDQAFTYELSSRKSAPILHSLAEPELLFFTSAGVQRVIPVEGEVFTPTTVAAKVASAFGAHELAKPQEAGANVLYPVERGAHLYELKPSDTLTGYDSNDVSIIAAHLIDKKDWVQTAFRRAPYPIWFGLRDDGIIIGLTYMPEQQVYAWHQHELPGAFVESIAVVPEGNVDSLYVIARREVLGSTVRYIERVEPRDFGEDQVDAYFVDSGITYRGSATNEVTGLDHLEGLDVMVLADGRVLGPYTVTAGGITIDEIASVIHVGLSYTSEVETLPIAYANQEGFGVGIMKNVSQIWLRIKQSLGFTAGVSFDEDDQRPLVDDAEEDLGDVPALRSGVHDITPVGVWSQDSTICIQQTQPLPFTITGMAADFVDG